jgi:phosphoribosylamine--glycine ligase
MIGPDGAPRTLEFNCRMGDPETQPIMARMKSDFVPIVEAAIDGRLDAVEVDWDRRVALGVVIAAAGYPDAPRKGDAITVLPADTDDCVTFHAGTALEADGRLLTTGGRVLCVTALGDSVRAAQRRAYEAVDQVRFAGAQFRRDIGHRALKPRG